MVIDWVRMKIRTRFSCIRGMKFRRHLPGNVKSKNASDFRTVWDKFQKCPPPLILVWLPQFNLSVIKSPEMPDRK